MLLAVCLVTLSALTPEFAEGDEAASLLHHALGRDQTLQPPFAFYQRGMDLLLGLLPARGETLLTAARALGTISGAACLLTLLGLAFHQAGPLTANERLISAAALLLAVPEFLYLGLLYTPLLAGTAAAAGAHLLIRSTFVDAALPPGRVRSRIAAALLLLMIAGLIRWDMFLYPAFILLDLFLHRSHLRSPELVAGRTLLLSALPALAAGTLLLLIAYGSPASLGSRMMHWAGFALLVPKAPDGWLELAGAYISVFTPGTLLLGGAGLVFLGVSRRPLLFLALVTILAAAVWPLWFSPKEMLLFSPLLVLLIVTGATAIIRTPLRRPIRALALGGGAAVLLLPWLVGVQGHHGDTAWGPGFAQRPLDRPVAGGRTARPVLGEGLALPTREGHRPLWGHGAVLLGGGWRRFQTARADERRAALALALRERFPVVRIPRSGLLEEAELARQGFTTTLPFIRGGMQPGEWRVRVFTRGEESLRLLEMPALSGTDVITALARDGSGRLPSGVIITGWAEPLRRLVLEDPARYTPLGPASLSLDLQGVQPLPAEAS